MATRDSLPRMKSCVVPATTTPLDWAPEINYAIGDIVKIGPYVQIAVDVGEGANNAMLWLAYPYGAAIKTDMTSVRLSAAVSALEILASASTPNLWFKLSPTASNNTPAKIKAAFDALKLESTANLTALSRIQSISFNPLWYTSPPGNPGGTANETFTDSSKYYKLTAVYTQMPANVGRFPLESAFAPQDQGFWTEVSSLANSDAGDRRTWCNTDIPYEATRCPRCGNPV